MSGAAVDRIGAEQEVEVLNIADRVPPAEFVSASPAMEAVWKIVNRVASTDVPVLIRGESGAGKDVVARTIHARSSRKNKPFLKINCAALPANLLESELFGYQKGAFTGAMTDTKGKFELASEGTLFLDEIGEMPPEMQAKLLQVLQDGEYFRVGGTKAVRVNTRVVVATNRDLEGAIQDGSFRRDLYYRLNVVSVRVPSLRERPEDIEPLATFFLQRYARRYDSGLDVLPDDVLRVFQSYPWPGNVRELENLIRRMVVLGDPRSVLSELEVNQTQLAPSVTSSAISSVAHVPSPAPALLSAVDALEYLGVIKSGELDTIPLKEIAHRAQVVAEREAIAHILRKCAWNKRKAAMRLQISYKALLYKIKECGIIDPRVEQSLPDELQENSI